MNRKTLGMICQCLAGPVIVVAVIPRAILFHYEFSNWSQRPYDLDTYRTYWALQTWVVLLGGLLLATILLWIGGKLKGAQSQNQKFTPRRATVVLGGFALTALFATGLALALSFSERLMKPFSSVNTSRAYGYQVFKVTTNDPATPAVISYPVMTNSLSLPKGAY